jgi:hypothetical protein
MISIKIFLCYVFADKHIGGELKECLENEFSFEVFVAHDDIEAGAEWNDSIQYKTRFKSGWIYK